MKKFYSFFLIIAVAMFSFVGGAQAQTTYKMITSLDDLVDGEYVVGSAANTETEATVTMGSFGTKNYSCNSVVSTSGEITLSDDIQLWTITKDGDYFTIQSVSTDKYVASNGSGTSSAAVSEVTDDARWIVTYNASYGGRFIFQNKTEDRRYLEYNKSAGLFSTYTGAGNNAGYPDLFLYLKDASTGPAVATPSFSLESCDITEATDVTISCTTAGASIYYTTDGTEPTSSSTLYSTTPISITATTTVKAIAINDGESSSVATAEYNFIVVVPGQTTLDFGTYDDFSNWSNSYDERTLSFTDATVLFASASKQTTTITDAPVTKGGDVTITLTDAAKAFAAITFTCTQWGSKTQTITLNVSTDGTTFTALDVTSTNFVLTHTFDALESYKAVKFTFSSSSNQVGIASFAFTTKDAVAVPTVETPSFSVESCDITEATSVTISCETEGATIYYTTDSTTPTAESTEYTSAITISETTTLKAIAVKGEESSSVATATYTFVIPSTIAEFIASADEDNETLLNDVTVIYQNYNNTWIQDATGSLLIYGELDDDMVNGDVISGLKGKYTTYQTEVNEIKDVSYTSVTVGGAEVAPDAIAIADLSVNDINKYVTISGSVVADKTLTSSSSSDFFVEDEDGNSIKVYTKFKNIDITLKAGDVVDVVCLVAYFGDNLQVYPLSVTINEDGPITATDVVKSTYSVYANKGMVCVECEAGAKVDVYSITGQRIYSEKATSTMNYFNVNNQGVVIVMVDGVATKIAVK